MIGYLPTSLDINGEEYEIRTDYRIVLNIFVAYNDPDLTDLEKTEVMLTCLYKCDINELKDIQESCRQAMWFFNGGNFDEAPSSPKVMDWEQDEQMIFSAINKVANKEIRAEEYIHWWTFLGYFREVGEGLFSTVVNIRQKRATGKKLEKYEKEFMEKNIDIVKLKPKYNEKERKEKERLEKLLRGD